MLNPSQASPWAKVKTPYWHEQTFSNTTAFFLGHSLSPGTFLSNRIKYNNNLFPKLIFRNQFLPQKCRLESGDYQAVSEHIN